MGERKSTVTTSYLDSDYKDWKWVTRQELRQPSSRQKRIMMALLLAAMTEWCMQHHLYMFDDKIYHQMEGTPIGLHVAVQISRQVMINWDRCMLKLLINKNIRVELFMRYVDDVDAGYRVLNNNKSVAALETEVAAIVTELADSIYPGVLTFEVDFPAKNESNTVAVLDMECYTDGKFIYHVFYMSSRHAVGPNSGFTVQVIRNIVIQEYLRRLLAFSPTLPDTMKFKSISIFNLDLMKAGHTEKFRKNMTAWAVSSYKKIVSTGPVYRDRQTIQQASQNRPDASSWFKRPDFS